MSSDLDALKEQLAHLVEQLELARSHVDAMIEHVDARDLARVGAHGFSVRGHLARAVALLDGISSDWADHSKP
jgi:hypothetical protein